MAEQSEAMVQRKTGGRQNVVLLRTLKRTRLASASACLFSKKNNTILIFIGQFTGRPVDAFDSAYVLPAMYIKRISLEKATELKFNERQRTEWKECRKDMKGKKRKQRRGKEKRGSKGVSPCALRTQIFQKKEKK